MSDNIFSKILTLRKANKDKRSSDEIMAEVDSLVRNSINSKISNRSLDRDNSFGATSGDLPAKFSTSAIVGKLKKRFAPNRGISDSGVHVNKFNMSDIYLSYVGENLVKFSVDKYAEACVRNGGGIDSKNPSIVKYLNKRLKEFEMVSKTSTKEFITDFMVSLIMYGNVPSVKHRQDSASSGNIYKRWDGVTLKPIASLYVEDFRKLILGEGPGGKMRYIRINQNIDEIKLNEINPSLFNLPKGAIMGSSEPLYNPYMFAQIYRGMGRLFRLNTKRRKDYVVYEEDDLDHVRYHHVPGEKIAMPPFWPTMNDIDSLRRIEENIELLIYQYGHPILHGKVGDERTRGEQDEINNLTGKLESMESNGFVITDNRVMLEMLGAENQAMRLDAYLLYFYRRVLTGLWLSEVTVGIGDTSNRSTANTLDKLSQEKVVELQKVFSDYFQQVLIELLLEAGATMTWILKPENIPSYVFKPVDIEGLIKQESHVLSLWQANMLQEDEMRRRLGEEPLTDADRKKTYNYLHAIPLKVAGGAGGGNTSTATSKKVSQQKLRPANQHGKKTGPSQSQNS
jgi:hypothetical protein